MGRFTTMPNAPRSLCSQTKVRVREKLGSCIAGMAMRKWLVRLIVCMGQRSRILILRKVWLKCPPEVPRFARPLHLVALLVSPRFTLDGQRRIACRAALVAAGPL